MSTNLNKFLQGFLDDEKEENKVSSNINKKEEAQTILKNKNLDQNTNDNYKTEGKQEKTYKNDREPEIKEISDQDTQKEQNVQKLKLNLNFNKEHEEEKEDEDKINEKIKEVKKEKYIKKKSNNQDIQKSQSQENEIYEQSNSQERDINIKKTLQTEEKENNNQMLEKLFIKSQTPIQHRERWFLTIEKALKSDMKTMLNRKVVEGKFRFNSIGELEILPDLDTSGKTSKELLEMKWD